MIRAPTWPAARRDDRRTDGLRGHALHPAWMWPPVRNEDSAKRHRHQPCASAHTRAASSAPDCSAAGPRWSAPHLTGSDGELSPQNDFETHEISNAIRTRREKAGFRTMLPLPHAQKLPNRTSQIASPKLQIQNGSPPPERRGEYDEHGDNFEASGHHQEGEDPLAEGGQVGVVFGGPTVPQPGPMLPTHDSAAPNAVQRSCPSAASESVPRKSSRM